VQKYGSPSTQNILPFVDDKHASDVRGGCLDARVANSWMPRRRASIRAASRQSDRQEPTLPCGKFFFFKGNPPDGRATRELEIDFDKSSEEGLDKSSQDFKKKVSFLKT
jgi:hypothetical protein